MSKALNRAKAVCAAELYIQKEKVLKNKEAHGVVSLFKIDSGRILLRYISRLDSDVAIEIFEDPARSGRPSEVVFEYLKNYFLQYLASRSYHVIIRSVERWLKSRRSTSCKDSAMKLLSSVGNPRVRLNIKPNVEVKHVYLLDICIVVKVKEVLHARSLYESASRVGIFLMKSGLLRWPW